MVAALACGPVIGVPGAGSESGEATTGATEVDVSASAADEATGVPPSMTTGTTVDATTEPSTGSSDDGDDPTVGFIPDPDGGPPGNECDVWKQDCPRGEKCMPWANDGGNSWNALRCSPIAEDPNEVGEPCTVEGSGVSGIDDCVLGAMCWDVDPDTDEGECVGFCQGSEANPTCADACSFCALTSSGVLILCLPTCDPIAQDCGGSDGCYPQNDTFVCAPDASGEQGGIGEACEYLNVCDPGSFCANADAVPECAGASGCCAPFCDAAGPDGCDTLLPGTSCVPWYDEGQQPGQCIGTAIIGACMVPS